MSTQPICDRINTYANRSVVIPGYEGIPQNLLVNVCLWAILLLCFSLLRKVAWDYGRLALVQPKRNRWTILFYSEFSRKSHDSESPDGSEINLAVQDPGYFSWIVKYFKLTSAELQSKAGMDAVHYLRFHLYLIIYTAVTTFICLTIILPVNIHGTLKSPDLQKFGVTTISNVSASSSALWLHTLMGTGFFILAFILMQHFAKQFRKDSNQMSTFSENTLMISGISRSHCQAELILRHFAEVYPEHEIDDIQVCYDIRKLLKLENEYETIQAALKYSQKSFELKGKRPLLIPHCCGLICKKCYHYNCCQLCLINSHSQSISSSSSSSYNINNQTQLQFSPDSGDTNLPLSISDSNQSADNVIITTSNLNNNTTNQMNMNTNKTNTNINSSGGNCWCFCSPCCLIPTPIDAIVYYSEQKELLKKQIETESEIAVKSKIGIAFITFVSKQSAAKIYQEFKSMTRCFTSPKYSSLSSQLRSQSWSVDFAPTPNNIIWENLSITRTLWWIRASVINLFVFLLIFFLTTPTYVLNLVNTLQITDRLQINNPFLVQFIPSMILWSVSALLPYVVYKSDRFVGHWTRSGLHLTVMTKTFTLLILMVLILPSLGLTSIPALLEWLFPEMKLIPLTPSHHNKTDKINTIAGNKFSTIQNDTNESNKTKPFIPIGPQTFQWECVFVPDNGAFFVNYVITSAFIGTALQLVRLPELIMYTCRLMFVRSQAEKVGVRKAIQYEFDFGLYYAWTLCVFAVICAYSILCPLITPFGLVYLILKYLVERYNLYYAYLPSKIDSRIHWIAISCMIASVFLLQINLFMFIILRLNTVGQILIIITTLSITICGLLMIYTFIAGWYFVGSLKERRRLLRQSVKYDFNESNINQIDRNQQSTSSECRLETINQEQPNQIQPVKDLLVRHQSLKEQINRSHDYSLTRERNKSFEQTQQNINQFIAPTLINLLNKSNSDHIYNESTHTSSLSITDDN